MKKVLLLLVSILSLTACTQKTADSEFSAQALGEVLIALDGSKIEFKDLMNKHKGSTVVIDVWASWCPDCIKGFPSLKDLQTQFPEVHYVFLSVDKTEEAWKEAIEKFQLQGDHYYITDGMKGKFGQSIALDWIPRYIVVNPQGKISLFKAIQADAPELINALKTQK